MWKRMHHARLPAPLWGKNGRSLYFAYGSNLSVSAMKRRCPDAIPLYPLTLNDCELVFRGVADVVHRKGAVCVGGVWAITPKCEKALDGYEGVEHGLYEKRYFDIKQRKSGLLRPVLFYKMRETGICPPAASYLAVLEQGYEDFGLEMHYLEKAVEDAWRDQEITPRIARRYHRKGQQPFAKPRQWPGYRSGEPDRSDLNDAEELR